MKKKKYMLIKISFPKLISQTNNFVLNFSCIVHIGKSQYFSMFSLKITTHGLIKLVELRHYIKKET